MNTAHDLLTRLFHWTMAFIILYTITAGYAMHFVIDSHPKVFKFLSIMNMSIATVGSLLFPLRFIWNYLIKKQESTTTLTQRIVKLAHSMIYFLMFLVFTTGFLMLTEPFPLFWLVMINNPINNPEVNAFFFMFHRFSCAGLTVLVAVHIAAALHHHYLLKDTTLVRMLGIPTYSHSNPYNAK
ncbi:cytochrome b [Vibrio sp. TBV020]|uniref:cytochrome b n=1 Tax=Vibrio sp. TBV020 TaxID=3137398 RepID=UPI0038CDA81E